ncbi:asparagine synthase (glutamine-hydrolyzing) [Tardiphaga sp. vice352]|uniref:asparagine synthase (glutamine-hydrolyzing) n=1 Tax=Tardiphaga sp. vice352 TaxID=2592816 RepID=UPI0011628A13|nr:asparagine synthase (glutamine-hydrolyzing) [Tardiphaga sp. vice352]QDM30455.1 asparagine synthase (glutamine-hydrolyzing) [Tardiphaga sp. vice352]
MCGIFGIASVSALAESRCLLEALTDRLQHRGPDERGSYLDDTVFLGHRRLSIIDLRGGRQPMTACDGRYVIVYNGELYNFREVRAALENRGHRFKTESDTEVILRAFAEWGAACVTRFNGMFAFAIWDGLKRALFLARDRLGIKPLYYSVIGQRLVFASEMKAITAHTDFQQRANLAALSSYLSFRSVLGEDTVFVGLKSLQPGHHLLFADGRVGIRQYWDIPHSLPRTDKGEDYYLTTLTEKLSQVIRRHLVSDVPVGAYLSGGLDSSLMVAIMAEYHAGPLRTYSVGFDVEGYDEGAHAEVVSQHLGTQHRHLTFGADKYIAMMDGMIQHRDQPLSIPHEVALCALSHELKKDVTVCLSGEGADELFGGYGRVQRSPMDYRKLAFYQRLPTPLQALIKLTLHDPDVIQRLGLKDDVAHLLHVYHWWPLAAKWDIFSDQVNAELDFDRAFLSRCHAVLDATRSDDAYDRVFYFFEKIHLLNLLDRLDVQSMTASVEARVPFVDHELVEFVWSIPLKYKMRWKSPLHRLRACFTKSENASEHLDVSKYLLRRVADGKLPPQISRRKKLGFPVPLDAWFGGSLQNFAREILLDGCTRRRGIFNMKNVEDLLLNPQHLAYDFYGKRIWMLLNVELWFRAHIDRAVSM